MEFLKLKFNFPRELKLQIRSAEKVDFWSLQNLPPDLNCLTLACLLQPVRYMISVRRNTSPPHLYISLCMESRARSGALFSLFSPQFIWQNLESWFMLKRVWLVSSQKRKSGSLQLHKAETYNLRRIYILVLSLQGSVFSGTTTSMLQAMAVRQGHQCGCTKDPKNGFGAVKTPVIKQHLWLTLPISLAGWWSQQSPAALSCPTDGSQVACSHCSEGSSPAPLAAWKSSYQVLLI